MTISPTQAAEFLSAHDRYLILTHVRPDGDTVGCAAALCRALRTLGKTAHVLPNPEMGGRGAPGGPPAPQAVNRPSCQRGRREG